MPEPKRATPQEAFQVLYAGMNDPARSERSIAQYKAIAEPFKQKYGRTPTTAEFYAAQVAENPGLLDQIDIPQEALATVGYTSQPAVPQLHAVPAAAARKPMPLGEAIAVRGLEGVTLGASDLAQFYENLTGLGGAAPNSFSRDFARQKNELQQMPGNAGLEPADNLPEQVISGVARGAVGAIPHIAAGATLGPVGLFLTGGIQDLHKGPGVALFSAVRNGILGDWLPGFMGRSGSRAAGAAERFGASQATQQVANKAGKVVAGALPGVAQEAGMGAWQGKDAKEIVLDALRAGTIDTLIGTAAEAGPKIGPNVKRATERIGGKVRPKDVATHPAATAEAPPAVPAPETPPVPKTASEAFQFADEAAEVARQAMAEFRKTGNRSTLDLANRSTRLSSEYQMSGKRMSEGKPPVTPKASKPPAPEPVQPAADPGIPFEPIANEQIAVRRAELTRGIEANKARLADVESTPTDKAQSQANIAKMEADLAALDRTSLPREFPDTRITPNEAKAEMAAILAKIPEMRRTALSADPTTRSAGEHQLKAAKERYTELLGIAEPQTQTQPPPLMPELPVTSAMAAGLDPTLVRHGAANPQGLPGPTQFRPSLEGLRTQMTALRGQMAETAAKADAGSPSAKVQYEAMAKRMVALQEQQQLLYGAPANPAAFPPQTAPPPVSGAEPIVTPDIAPVPLAPGDGRSGPPIAAVETPAATVAEPTAAAAATRAATPTAQPMAPSTPSGLLVVDAANPSLKWADANFGIKAGMTREQAGAQVLGRTQNPETTATIMENLDKTGMFMPGTAPPPGATPIVETAPTMTDATAAQAAGAIPIGVAIPETTPPPAARGTKGKRGAKGKAPIAPVAAAPVSDVPPAGAPGGPVRPPIASTPAEQAGVAARAARPGRTAAVKETSPTVQAETPAAPAAVVAADPVPDGNAWARDVYGLKPGMDPQKAWQKVLKQTGDEQLTAEIIDQLQATSFFGARQTSSADLRTSPEGTPTKAGDSTVKPDIVKRVIPEFAPDDGSPNGYQTGIVNAYEGVMTTLVSKNAKARKDAVAARQLLAEEFPEATTETLNAVVESMQANGTIQSIDPLPVDKHDFASSQVELAGTHRTIATKMGRAIPDADLADKGRETSPHITVRYGLEDASPAVMDTLEQALSGLQPIRAKAGVTKVFEADAKRDNDVLYVEVESPQLQEINRVIKEAVPGTDTTPGYTPHITLAYLKPGRGAAHAGDKTMSGKEMLFDTIQVSDRDGVVRSIKLNGQPTDVPAKAGTAPSPDAIESVIKDLPPWNPDTDGPSRSPNQLMNVEKAVSEANRDAPLVEQLGRALEQFRTSVVENGPYNPATVDAASRLVELEASRAAQNYGIHGSHLLNYAGVEGRKTVDSASLILKRIDDAIANKAVQRPFVERVPESRISEMAGDLLLLDPLSPDFVKRFKEFKGKYGETLSTKSIGEPAGGETRDTERSIYQLSQADAASDPVGLMADIYDQVWEPMVSGGKLGTYMADMAGNSPIKATRNELLAASLYGIEGKSSAGKVSKYIDSLQPAQQDRLLLLMDMVDDHRITGQWKLPADAPAISENSLAEANNQGSKLPPPMLESWTEGGRWLRTLQGKGSATLKSFVDKGGHMLGIALVARALAEVGTAGLLPYGQMNYATFAEFLHDTEDETLKKLGKEKAGSAVRIAYQMAVPMATEILSQQPRNYTMPPPGIRTQTPPVMAAR